MMSHHRQETVSAAAQDAPSSFPMLSKRQENAKQSSPSGSPQQQQQPASSAGSTASKDSAPPPPQQQQQPTLVGALASLRDKVIQGNQPAASDPNNNAPTDPSTAPIPSNINVPPTASQTGAPAATPTPTTTNVAHPPATSAAATEDGPRASIILGSVLGGLAVFVVLLALFMRLKSLWTRRRAKAMAPPTENRPSPEFKHEPTDPNAALVVDNAIPGVAPPASSSSTSGASEHVADSAAGRHRHADQTGQLHGGPSAEVFRPSSMLMMNALPPIRQSAVSSVYLPGPHSPTVRPQGVPIGKLPSSIATDHHAPGGYPMSVVVPGAGQHTAPGQWYPPPTNYMGPPKAWYPGEGPMGIVQASPRMTGARFSTVVGPPLPPPHPHFADGGAGYFVPEADGFGSPRMSPVNPGFHPAYQHGEFAPPPTASVYYGPTREGPQW